MKLLSRIGCCRKFCHPAGIHIQRRELIKRNPVDPTFSAADIPPHIVEKAREVKFFMDRKMITTLLGLTTRPQRLHFTSLPEAGERDENQYMTLHDHFVQTAALRRRIRELEAREANE